MKFTGHNLRFVCLFGLGILACRPSSFSPPALLGASVPAGPGAASASVSQPDPAARARAVESYGKLPLSFEQNNGQTDQRVKFLSRGSGYTLFLTGNEAVLALPKAASGKQKSAGNPRNPQSPKPDVALHGAARRSLRDSASVLRMRLVGANPTAEVSGLDELPGKSNYFIGNDPKKWRTDVPNYAKVKYESVYPGVDLVYYGNQRQLEYDFVVAPGADPSAIRLNVRARLASPKGAQRAAPLRIDSNGDLVVGVAGDEVRFHKPVVYQSATAQSSSPATGQSPLQSPATGTSESRHYLDGRYVLQAGNQVRFQVDAYDRTQPLIIDPVLVYSSLVGGSLRDVGWGIAVDASGNAYLAGEAQSVDFPRVNQIPGACNGTCGTTTYYGDAFVTKINAAGDALIYSSFIGGSGVDGALAIAVDGSGNAYLTGLTYCLPVCSQGNDFPIVNQISGACNGSCGHGNVDVFLTKINAAGDALAYSSLIGGSLDENGQGVALDGLGNAYLMGWTESADFPRVNQIPGACQGSCGIGYNGDIFVNKVNAAGSALVYSSLVGGSGPENEGGQGGAIAVDSSGNAYVTGQTLSDDFPRVNQIPGACQGSCGSAMGLPDAFVTKISAAGSALVYSSLLGGSGSDAGDGIAVDGSDNAFVTGYTISTDFPRMDQIPGACRGGCGRGYNIDAFVTKVNAAGSALVYSSLLGGSGPDADNGIAVDGSGNAYLTGYTESSDFPQVDQIPGACQGSCGSGSNYDAFVTKINAAGNTLVYSSYLGGSDYENIVNSVSAGRIAVDGSGNAYLTGPTYSADFPRMNQIPGACQGSCGSGGHYHPVAFVTKISAGGPAVGLSPTSLDFGLQGINNPNTPQVVTLTNGGDAPLNITSIGITGTNSGDFDQTNNCPISPNTLAPGDHCNITVVFSPTETRTLSADVTITDNAPDSPQMVPLTGIGVGGKVRPK